MRNYAEIHTVLPTKALRRIEKILGIGQWPDFTADGIMYSISSMGFGKGTFALNLSLWGPKDAKDTALLDKLLKRLRKVTHRFPDFKTPLKPGVHYYQEDHGKV